jgi:hypothetical protein
MQAIDKLEDILDNGLKDQEGTGRMFGNTDYIKVYT